LYTMEKELILMKKRVTFTLDEYLVKRLKAVSDESMIAQAKLVEKAVTAIVEEYEQRTSQK